MRLGCSLGLENRNFHKKHHTPPPFELHQTTNPINVDDRLVAGEIVESNKRTKLDLLRPSIKIVPHAIRIAKLLATSRRMGCEIKVCRLFVQEKYVPMRCTHGRRSGADIIGDERRVRHKHPLASDFDIGLDPVKDGS